MIPRAFTAFLSAAQKRQFNQDWNLQPMHKACNERRVGQFAGDWPLFKCRCHFLQVAGPHMYVHDRLQRSERRHLLLEDAVSDEIGTFRLFTSRLPPDGSGVGYAKDAGGHLLPTLPLSLAQPFNWFERARVGLATGRLSISGSNGERAVVMPDGRVVSLSGHPVSRTYPLRLGHHLLRFDPHSPGGPS